MRLRTPDGAVFVQMLGAATVAVALSSVVQAATITVDTNGDSGGAGDCTLRQAIDSINAGADQDGCTASGAYGADDIVNFDPTVNGVLTLSGSALDITASVMIQGPGADSLAVDGDQQSRVFTIGGAGTEVSIDGLTLQNGKESASKGGGILVEANAGLVITESTIQGNYAQNGGGGIFVEGDADLTVQRTTISDNDGEGGFPGGGGIYAGPKANVTLLEAAISDNKALFGGGIYVDSATVQITNSTVAGNSTYEPAGEDSTCQGGGIFTTDTGGVSATVTLEKSTISNNSTCGNVDASGGGIAAFGSSSVALSNSTVSGNEATKSGGGMFLFNELVSTVATLVNTTVSGNTAPAGAGLAMAKNTGGGSLSVSLANTLVASNNGGDCQTNDPAVVTATSSLVGDAASACGLTNSNGNLIGVAPADVAIQSLADNGCDVPAGNPLGPSQYFSCVKTHALLAESQAVDAADAAQSPARDQRGVARPQRRGFDIGSFELRSETRPPQPKQIPAATMLSLLLGAALLAFLGMRRLRGQKA